MIKVLIVDDSVFMRTVIRDMLAKDVSIEVVGTASDGLDALEKIAALCPFLTTLPSPPDSLCTEGRDSPCPENILYPLEL